MPICPDETALYVARDGGVVAAADGVVAVFTGYFKDDERSEIELEPIVMKLLDRKSTR